MFAKTILFISLLILSDFGLGSILKASFNSSKDLGIARLNYTFKATSENILILGSSRAMHHFVPGIVSAKTKKTVYNCGFEGQGLKFCYLQLREITARYLPDHVILEISPNILTDSLSDDKLNILMPFAEKDTAVANAITGKKLMQKVKLFSRIYPYNSLLFDLVYSKYKSVKDSFNGFVPLHAEMSGTQRSSAEEKTSYASVRSTQLESLDRIINLWIKNSIRLDLVISPVFELKATDKIIITEMKNYLLKYRSIRLSDYSTFTTTYGNPLLFKDNLHLNKRGASLFSEEIGTLLAHS